MCAIAGHVSFAAPPDETRVSRLLRALAHRGPDGSGIARAGAACLGHNRLALLDRDGGAQPMRSRDGRFTLTFNGEIYNHAELRAALDGEWHFHTRSDTEALLAALVTWGAAALPRLDGMFALFLWDAQRQQGLAARDRLGVKPFVYRARAGDFSFASEAKALVAADDTPPRANDDAILEYLVAPMFSGVAAPMFAGLDYLPAGHLLRLDRDGVTVARWWRHALAVPGAAGDGGDDGDAHAETHVAAVRARLAAAVQRALAADAPIGIFLSGGLDSTLLAMLGRERLARAFTVAFAGQHAFDYARSAIVLSDDEPFAELAAAAAQLPRQRVPVARERLAQDLAALAAVDDALPAWEQELAQLHLARAARAHVKAVLVGDAADETHFGYHFLLDDAALAGPAAILLRFGGVPIRRDRLADPVAHFDRRYRALVADAGHDWESRASRRLAMTRLIVERWLPRLLHNGDIHCMAASLEARVPFADAALLEAAGHVPPALGLNDGVEKWVLRQAARDLVPEPIRRRRKSALPKDQAVAPIYQQEARRLVDEMLPLLRVYVDLPALAPLLDDGRRLDEGERAALFRVIGLAHWARHYGVRA
jgi:asparagine synthase (glutamine-hydrolysing)